MAFVIFAGHGDRMALGNRRKPGFRVFGRSAVVSIIAFLVGCASAQDYLDRQTGQLPRLSAFPVCHGYGCRWRTMVNMDPSAWEEVRALFRPAPRSAAEERIRLGRAIALMELKVGAAAGTATDEAEAETFSSGPDQLDCIDETVNTTTYLRLLEQDGLLRWHRIGRAERRGWLLAPLFRSSDFITNTAVIVEKDTGERYAIDSYFYANGRQPAILPLAVWRQNWRPQPGDRGRTVFE
ncbi:MAG: hypothetical protein D6690_16635 [Nitrospirae bacterium]|nr:MAG: hypothetical protein D6690_16635 [Nitrospirota bacterium]